MQVQLDHIGIAVNGLQESIALYETAFGFSVCASEYVEQQQVNVAMLSANRSPGFTQLELLEATDEQSALGKFMKKSGAGIHHLALRVDNLEEAISMAQAQGLETIGEPQGGFGNSRFVFIHPRSTGGVLLELLQREPQ